MNQLIKKLLEKKYIFIGIFILLILIILWVYLLSSNEKAKKFIEDIKHPYKPLYISRVEKIDSKFYDNKDFISCFRESITDCWKDHLKKEISYTWSILDTLNYLSKFEWSITFDNCIWDKIDFCYNKTISESIDKTPDVSICDAYTDIVLKQNCLKDMYVKLAIFKDDISECSANTDPLQLQYCQDEYNTEKWIKSQDITYCDKLSQDFSKKICKDNFYFSVAVNLKDVNYCKNAWWKEDISNCAQNYINQTIFRSEIKNCEKIKTYWVFLKQEELNNMYNRCVLEDINNKLSQLDPKKDREKYMELCQKLPDENIKKDCLVRVIDTAVNVQTWSLTPEDVGSWSLFKEFLIWSWTTTSSWETTTNTWGNK